MKNILSFYKTLKLITTPKIKQRNKQKLEQIIKCGKARKRKYSIAYILILLALSQSDIQLSVSNSHQESQFVNLSLEIL